MQKISMEWVHGQLEQLDKGVQQRAAQMLMIFGQVHHSYGNSPIPSLEYWFEKVTEAFCRRYFSAIISSEDGAKIATLPWYAGVGDFVRWAYSALTQGTIAAGQPLRIEGVQLKPQEQTIIQNLCSKLIRSQELSSLYALALSYGAKPFTADELYALFEEGVNDSRMARKYGNLPLAGIRETERETKHLGCGTPLVDDHRWDKEKNRNLPHALELREAGNNTVFICLGCGKIDMGPGRRIGYGWVGSNECYEVSILHPDRKVT